MSHITAGLVSAIASARSEAARQLALLLAKARSDRERASEKLICAGWLEKMAAVDNILAEGWYQPPPSGAAVLLGQPPTFDRLAYASLRDESSWPSANQVLTDESLLYAYASPVDRETGLIGDIGVTLYGGADRRIRDYLSDCLTISISTARHAEVGVPLSSLYRFADTMITKLGYRNQTPSTTDPSSMNIGHTIPWSYESGLTEPRLDDPAKLQDQIRRGRIFLNGAADVAILPDMAFTIEPRMIADDLPLCGYHIIVVFESGKRTILTNFDEVFQCFGMDYLLGQVR